jgi:hypothetical protein
MKMKLTSRGKTLLALIVIGAVFNIISVYLLFSLDHLIHGDLYAYGLQFSPEWAETYYFHFWLAMGSVIAALALWGFSILLLGVYVAKRSQSALLAIPILLLISIIMGVLSIYAAFIIDTLVNTDFYGFGLQFNYSWAWSYWLHIRFLMALQALSIVFAAVSAGLVILNRVRPKRGFNVASSLLLIAGSLILAFSIYSIYSMDFDSAMPTPDLTNLTIPVIIGLGLVLWGIITRYLTSQEYVKKDFLASLAIANYSSIDRVFKEMGLVQRAIYLPAQYLNDVGSNLVFLTKNINDKLPSSERVMLEDQLNVGVEKGKLLSPPGHGLAKLIEKCLGKSFTKVNLDFLVQNLRKVVTENLELVKDFRIKAQNNSIQIFFEDAIFSDVRLYGAGKFSKIIELIGCPFSSAVACALAKATGKPTVISQYQRLKGRNAVNVTYQLLE